MFLRSVLKLILYKSIIIKTILYLDTSAACIERSNISVYRTVTGHLNKILRLFHERRKYNIPKNNHTTYWLIHFISSKLRRLVLILPAHRKSISSKLNKPAFLSKVAYMRVQHFFGKWLSKTPMYKQFDFKQNICFGFWTSFIIHMLP